MKRQVFLLYVVLVAMLFAACNSKSGSFSKEVEQQLATFDEVESIMNKMESNAWSLNIDEIKTTFEAKGYELNDDDEPYRYYFIKNCNLINDDNGISFTKISQDSLASAVCFLDFGAGGINADFYLFEDEVYNLIIEQAKACGFKVATAEEKQKYEEYVDVKSETDFIYKGKAYLVQDKTNHRITLRYIPFLPEDLSAEAKPGISEKLTCENYLNLMGFVDDESYAEKCGLKRIYKDVSEQGDVEYVYGYDVEKGGKGNLAYGFDVKPTSDYACYVLFNFLSFGSLDAALYFKDRQDAESFFNSATAMFEKENGNYCLSGSKIPNNNKKKGIEIEQLYMSRKVHSENGWYMIGINTGDFGD